MANTTAARRYAKALFALSLEKKAVEAVHSDLEKLAGLMHQSEEWRMLIRYPFGSSETRAKLMDQLLKGRVHDVTFQFMGFLGAKRRMSILPEIQSEWTKLYDHNKGNVRATVISAKPLTGDQLASLTDRLIKRCGKNVILTAQVEPSIIGGVRVHIGDQVLDYSIETQLQRLQRRMVYSLRETTSP